VDLVDEHDLALGQRGQHGGQVACALDRRAAGDPQRRAELGGDDHRDRGLAQPGRPGDQHVVGRPAAAQRALQDQRQLLAHPGLADELGQALGPQRALDHPVVGVGDGRHHPLLVRLGGSVAGYVVPPARLLAHVRPSTRRAARNATDTSTGWSPAA
jgi:hypothetical protein